jgi:hypothetical protein
MGAVCIVRVIADLPAAGAGIGTTISEVNRVNEMYPKIPSNKGLSDR